MKQKAETIQPSSADEALLSDAVTPLLYWYRANGRKLPWRDDPTPYHVWISEVMLQQTRVEAVKPYYERFLSRFPTVASLAAADDELLLKTWEGLGYYSRARNLKKGAAAIMERFGGEIPSDPGELLRVPGIGPYTAGAVASIAYGKPCPAIDGNVLRVVSRLLDDHADVSLPATKTRFSELLSAVYPAGDCSAFTQSLMELGACVCVPNGAPLCRECPLRHLCRAEKENTADMLPVRPEKKPRRIENRTVLLLFCRGKVAILKRPQTGLLAGLYEFPNMLSGDGTIPTGAACVGGAVHIFTHVEWHMTGYRMTLPEPDPAYLWVEPDELEQTYPIPSAFRYFRSLVMKGRLQ